jgi:tetratricopeptide (TPR) repeat protein
VTGVLYNSNYLGGFCLYHGFRPLVDGRWEVYDPAVLTRIFEAPFKPDVWEWLVSSYGVGGAVLMHASPEAAALLPSLGRDPRWRLVYYDNAASFWLRVAAGQIPPPADISTFPASVGKGWRIEDFLATSAFFRLVGAPATALTCLEQGALLQEKRELVLEKIGQVQLDLGKTADSEQTFLRLLQVNGRNTAAMNELAFIAYGRGDLQRAASYLRRALQLKPGDPDIRANYERLVNDSRFTTGGK